MDLITQFENAVNWCTRYHTEYMGKAMPDDVYDKFKRLRDETIPALKNELRAAIAWNDLLTYVLQGDMHNRLTPRVIDIAYTAFMCGKQPNSEDGGASDWFNDTKPMVEKAIDKLRKDLDAARAAHNKVRGADHTPE